MSGATPLESVLRAATAFEERHADLEDLQARIGSAIALLESPDRHREAALRRAEDDLEMIRFARTAEQQRPQALAVVRRLRAALQGPTTGGPPG